MTLLNGSITIIKGSRSLVNRVAAAVMLVLAIKKKHTTICIAANSTSTVNRLPAPPQTHKTINFVSLTSFNFFLLSLTFCRLMSAFLILVNLRGKIMLFVTLRLK